MTCPMGSNEETGARRGKKRLEPLHPPAVKRFSFPEDNPSPVILISNRGGILYHNKAALSLLRGLGWKQGDGMPAAWNDYVEKAVESGTPQKAEVKSDEIIYALTFVPDKTRRHVTAYGFNATDWRSAEEKFRTLVETINDWVWEIDTCGVYTYASPKVKDLFGFEPQEMLGKTCFDFMEAEEAQRVRDIFERIVEAEEPFSGLRNTCLRKDGKRVIVETAGTPVFDPHGKLVGYRGTDRDITDRVIVEDELRESRDFIENLVESSVDGILAYDHEFRCTVWNPAMEKISGMSKEAVLGKNAFEAFPFLRQTGEDKLMLEALSGRTTSAADRHYSVPETGHEGFFEARYSPLRSESGQIIGGLGIIRDTTERKLAERAVRESEERFRQLAENIGSVFWMVKPDWSEVIYISNAYETVWGRSRESLYNDARSWFEAIIPEDRAPVAAELEKKRHQDFSDAKFPAYRIVRPDGTVRWIEARAFPVRDEKGNIHRVAGICEDVTEQRLAQEAIRESEERFRQLAENIRQVFWIMAVDFSEVFYISPAYEEVWHRSRESLYADPASWLESVVEEDRGWLVEAVQKRLAGKEPGGRLPPYRIRRPDGEVRWIQARSVLLKDDTGKITRIAGVAEDITESKQAEQERERLLEMLEAKNKELQSVVYIASHDLRSPLVNIYGFSRQLAESCEQLRGALQRTSFAEEAKATISPVLEEDIPQALNFIHSGADKMQKVIDGLLKISRVGTAHLTISPLDMQSLVNAIVEAMNYEIRDRGADVMVEELPACAGDRDQIDQAFSNLLNNAVKYLHPERKGRIKIWGRQEGAMSVYCIEDNGLGIPAEHQERVFEIFHRVDPGCGVAGDGLGLSIVSRILDRHKGRIWLESEPGEGSRFFVALPAT